ncbi:MAG: peptidyl-tRNA hydrolase [Polyangiales bacterium]
MSEYDNPHDRPEAVHERSAQEDPWVMYLVVRRERLPSLAETVCAGAVAAVDCVAGWRDDPTWREGFDAWLARSFRKVCLRANEKDWARLATYDRGVGLARAEPVVAALPPRKKSQRDKLLVHLQAFATGEHAEAPPPRELPHAMRLVLNGDLAMSTGKAVAQAAHASLHALAAFGADDPDGVARWRLAGMPCELRRATGREWAALKAVERVAVVRDAGLTEIAPGSETFLAMAPSDRGRWSSAYLSLPTM